MTVADINNPTPITIKVTLIDNQIYLIVPNRVHWLILVLEVGLLPPRKIITLCNLIELILIVCMKNLCILIILINMYKLNQVVH